MGSRFHHSLLLPDMLEASFPEASVMVSSFIARYSPPKQCVLSISPPSIPPSPLLLCQMTNAYLMTDTPYQGSEQANVSKC